MNLRSQKLLDKLYKEMYNNQTIKDWEAVDKIMGRVRELEKETDSECIREEDTEPIRGSLSRKGPVRGTSVAVPNCG